MNTNGKSSTGKGSEQKQTALILAGAAAKGPYAAGALAVIARNDRFDIRCVVGASSGAMNAAVFAAGLRAGKAGEAADLLCKLWENQATPWNVLPYWRRLRVVKDAVTRFAKDPEVLPVRLDVVVTSLPGVTTDAGSVSYEDSHSFKNRDFTDPQCIDRMARTCVASAAIPVLFAPRKVGGDGPYWDGGLVNNAPIGVALKRHDGVDHVIVVSPDALAVEHRWYHRFSVTRLFSILIEERLTRDLDEAKSFNEELEKLGELVDLEVVNEKLKWRLLKFIEVRPPEDLAGGLLTGFISPGLRRGYVESGRAAADRALRVFSQSNGAGSALAQGAMADVDSIT